MQYDKNHYSYVEEEIRRHLKDSEISMLSHWHAAKVFEFRHKYYIGLPALVMSLLLTCLLSADAKDLFSKNGFDATAIGALNVFLGLLVSVLSALGTFLNFNELASKH